MQQQSKDLWNSNLYDTNHSFVSSYGQDLITLLDVKQGERILDVGCGTGELAYTIQNLGADVIGIDQSSNMVNVAKQKYPSIPFYVMDAAKLPYHNEFDAIFSNAVLHWIKAPEAVLQSMFTSLKHGGRFVAEFGGAGNVKLITDELIQQIRRAGIVFSDEQFPWYFPTIGQYTALLESVGFHVHFAYHFERPTKLTGEDGLKNWLEMFSPSIFEGIEEHVKHHIFQTTIENLQPVLYKDQTWYADYKRLRIVAYKK